MLLSLIGNAASFYSGMRFGNEQQQREPRVEYVERVVQGPVQVKHVHHYCVIDVAGLITDLDARAPKALQFVQRVMLDASHGDESARQSLATIDQFRAKLAAEALEHVKSPCQCTSCVNTRKLEEELKNSSKLHVVPEAKPEAVNDNEK